jgi:predicted secreted acid phosphatase
VFKIDTQVYENIAQAIKDNDFSNVTNDILQLVELNKDLQAKLIKEQEEKKTKEDRITFLEKENQEIRATLGDNFLKMKAQVVENDKKIDSVETVDLDSIINQESED